jgi:hypothetical protein
MTVAENLEAAHRVNRNGQVIEEGTRRVGQNTNRALCEQSQEEEEYVGPYHLLFEWKTNNHCVVAPSGVS